MHNPRNIIITGATGEIGTALALAYSHPNNILGLTGRNRERLEQLAHQCQQKGADVIIQEADISDSELLGNWIVDFDKQHPVDLVIANAGITSNTAPHGDPESWDTIKRVFDINLFGALGTVTPLVEPMRKRGHGQIAIMSSLGAYRGLPLTPAYCGSKAAIKVYGEALRGLVATDGVAVSVICPGFVKSAMSDNFPGPKPFMISPQKAAKIIVSGLSKNRGRISFPFPLNLGVWLLSMFPSVVADFILTKLKYGAPPQRK